MRRLNVPSDGTRSSNQTGSSAASAQAANSSEAASASGAEYDEDGEDEDESTEDDEPIITFRFEHKQDTDGHHVVVGREGVLRCCEDEPITTPGAVQGFGVLMVLEEEYETGDLVVRQVSEVSSSDHDTDTNTDICRMRLNYLVYLPNTSFTYLVFRES